MVPVEFRGCWRVLEEGEIRKVAAGRDGIGTQGFFRCWRREIPEAIGSKIRCFSNCPQPAVRSETGR
jgi:hypothetical protein